MIRLNNASETRINEKDINLYRPKDELGLPVITMVICGDAENLYYNNEQLRDKDIELLDQLFDVKDIKEQVEIAKLKKEVASHDMSIPSECASEYISNLNTCAPVKKSKPEIRVNIMQEDKYLTWDEVCNKKGEYFSAEISNVLVTLLYNGHEITIFNGNAIASFVYSKDLFNALKLKKVE